MAANIVPEDEEKFHVRLKFRAGGVFGNGADDEAGARRPQILDYFLQLLAGLLVLDFAGDPDMVGHRHEDHVTAGQGDVAGQAGSLGADRLLADLHQHILAFIKQIA